MMDDKSPPLPVASPPSLPVGDTVEDDVVEPRVGSPHTELVSVVQSQLEELALIDTSVNTPAASRSPEPKLSSDPLSIDELALYLSPQPIGTLQSVIAQEPQLPTLHPISTIPSEIPQREAMDTAGCADTALVQPATDETYEQEYLLKEIVYKDCRRKIMTQQGNGPCPLISIVNLLILQDRFTFNHNEFKVSSSRVLGSIVDMLLQEKEEKGEISDSADAKVDSAINTLQKCLHGLDVNVRFTKVDEFEETDSQALFEMLGVNLYHGWIADEASLTVIGNRSYNEAACYGDSQEDKYIAEWLELHRTQITYEGIIALQEKMKEDDLAVLFRNNHFYTMTKHDDILYLLVSDMGYNEFEGIVFESLVDITQRETFFVDGSFTLSDASAKLERRETASTAAAVEDSACAAESITATQLPPPDTSTDEDVALAWQLQMDLDEEAAIERENSRRGNADAAQSRTGVDSPSRATQRNERAKPKGNCSVM